MDETTKRIFEEVQSMKSKDKTKYLFDNSTKELKKRDESEESQWYAAKAKYGELEAYHVIADEWGCSIHEVKRKIARWDISWL